MMCARAARRRPKRSMRSTVSRHKGSLLPPASGQSRHADDPGRTGKQRIPSDRPLLIGRSNVCCSRARKSPYRVKQHAPSMRARLPQWKKTVGEWLIAHDISPLASSPARSRESLLSSNPYPLSASCDTTSSMDFQRPPDVAGQYRRKDLRRLGNGTLVGRRFVEPGGVHDAKRTGSACAHMDAMSRPVGEEKAADRVDSRRGYSILWSNLERPDRHLTILGETAPKPPRRGRIGRCS